MITALTIVLSLIDQQAQADQRDPDSKPSEEQPERSLCLPHELAKHQSTS